MYYTYIHIYKQTYQYGAGAGALKSHVWRKYQVSLSLCVRESVCVRVCSCSSVGHAGRWKSPSTLGSCGGFAGRCRSRRSQGTCSLLLRLHFLYTLTACSRSPAPSPLPSIPSCLAQLCRPSSGLPAWHLQCDNRGTCPAAALAPSRFCAPIRARAARSSPLTGPRTAPRRAEALLFSTAGSSFQQRNFSRIYSPWCVTMADEEAGWTCLWPMTPCMRHRTRRS